MGFTPAQQESNIAQFFSDLSLDGRFANLKGNSWDLRKRQSLANTKSILIPSVLKMKKTNQNLLMMKLKSPLS